MTALQQNTNDVFFRQRFSCDGAWYSFLSQVVSFWDAQESDYLGITQVLVGGFVLRCPGQWFLFQFLIAGGFVTRFLRGHTSVFQGPITSHWVPSSGGEMCTTWVGVRLFSLATPPLLSQDFLPVAENGEFSLDIPRPRISRSLLSPRDATLCPWTPWRKQLVVIAQNYHVVHRLSITAQLRFFPVFHSGFSQRFGSLVRPCIFLLSFVLWLLF